jgi:hypothetical protein
MQLFLPLSLAQNSEALASYIYILVDVTCKTQVASWEVKEI